MKLNKLKYSLAFAALVAAFAGMPATVQATSSEDIDILVEDAMAQGLVAGGVVVIGNRDGILYQRAYGRTSGLPSAPYTEIDTVFDIASLTKVVATTTSIMKLAEEGKLSLVDPVKKWFPEFQKKGKNDLLVYNLLTHTSGFRDFPLSPVMPMRSAIEGAAKQQLLGEPGTRFNYADINFILLGELVRRVSGETLDRYSARNFFQPLGMWNTGFNPGDDLVIKCASTLGGNGAPQVGLVQDYTARQLGGVAGHAGIFATAGDLSRFCRMILNNGKLDGRRVLTERAVQQMTAPYFSRGGRVVRGLGWDRESPYSAPRGDGFSEISFGHTGYSGTSLWIDPESDLYVVLLTSRLDFRNVSLFNKLRSDLSSLTANLFASRVKMAGDTRLTGDSRL